MISVDNDTEQVKPTEYWWKHKFMEYFRKKKKKISWFLLSLTYDSTILFLGV